MRGIIMFAAAFVLAAGAFWATMLTAPPASKAAHYTPLDIREMTIKANPGAGERHDAF
ncbi:hypothetical protein [Methylobacterium durans]|uniref:hypothetical protein n=1 Tax=Methylobacterium durans TaxID=2202825 RepID=UPI00187E1437|nr:hypothetical protein [Methylobacterium durans]